MDIIARHELSEENGDTVTYTVANESFEDDYGSLVINYVPYREDKLGKKRLSPSAYSLSQIQAEGFIPLLRK